MVIAPRASQMPPPDQQMEPPPPQDQEPPPPPQDQGDQQQDNPPPPPEGSGEEDNDPPEDNSEDDTSDDDEGDGEVRSPETIGDDERSKRRCRVRALRKLVAGRGKTRMFLKTLVEASGTHLAKGLG